jgi:hypothetical protein
MRLPARHNGSSKRNNVGNVTLDLIDGAPIDKGPLIDSGHHTVADF